MKGSFSFDSSTFDEMVLELQLIRGLAAKRSAKKGSFKKIKAAISILDCLCEFLLGHWICELMTEMGEMNKRGV